MSDTPSLVIGLVINPIAGVGAALAWKGTDNVDAAWDAITNGKPQPIWDIVSRALASIPDQLKIKWFFGGEYPLSIAGQIVHRPPDRSTAEDTKHVVNRFVEQGVNLIVFAGGDGTAADVATESQKTPIIGIPGGVKIFSPCFLHRPEDLGNFLLNWDGATTLHDILDLDEDLYRAGHAQAKLITSATVPVSSLVQMGKVGTPTSDRDTLELIAERIQDDNMLQKSILVGPGSTMHGIFAALGHKISLLGVDYLVNGEIQVIDCTTDQIKQLHVDEIWITPIGNQGHIFGRGNRQIPAKVIEIVGKQGIRVFATIEKMRNTKTLYVDTGDKNVDSLLTGYISVIVGYHDEIVKKVV